MSQSRARLIINEGRDTKNYWFRGERENEEQWKTRKGQVY